MRLQTGDGARIVVYDSTGILPAARVWWNFRVMGHEDVVVLDGGLPNVPVHDLFVHPRDRELIAGTHGRSAWIVDVLPVQQLSSEVRNSAVHLFHIDDLKASRDWRRRPDPGRRARWISPDRMLINIHARPLKIGGFVLPMNRMMLAHPREGKAEGEGKDGNARQSGHGGLQ